MLRDSTLRFARLLPVARLATVGVVLLYGLLVAGLRGSAQSAQALAAEAGESAGKGAAAAAGEGQTDMAEKRPLPSDSFLAAQLREAKAGNYWAKYRLWAAYHKGANGVQKDPEKAQGWLAELIDGAYLATFRPANGFAPKTPGEFLAQFSEHSDLRSEPAGLGGASFFRTQAKHGVLIGSFLTAYPDKMRQDIAANPSLELISIEKLTPEMFVRHEASPQESLDTAGRGYPQSGGIHAKQQAKARERMRRDAKTFSVEELREIESLYQVANQKWRTQEARDSLKRLTVKYKKANRTGCAILYLGQMSQDDEQLAYLKQAIADYGDCFYGDGVQVGAFARFLLGQANLQRGNTDLAKPLFDEIRTNYPDSIDHNGNLLVAQLPQSEKRGGTSTTELSYDDGKPDGKRSIGGSGEMISFSLPTDRGHINGIRIHGSRYGLQKPPAEDFLIHFLSKDTSEILFTETAPYKLFQRGKEKWVDVNFKKVREVPKTFWVVLDFRAHQTKGVYVSYDTSTGGKHSKVGLPGGNKPEDVDFGGDWMIRVKLAKKGD